MFPLAKYTKLLIVKHAYRNSAKLVYTLTFSLHSPFCSTCASKWQSLCLTVSYNYLKRTLNQAKLQLQLQLYLIKILITTDWPAK